MVGNKSRAPLYSPPNLSGRDHPGNPWLVVLRLTVKDLVRLTVGDEDSLPHLSVQAGLECPLHLEREGCWVRQPLWMFILKVFGEGILAVVRLYAAFVLANLW